MKDNAQKKIIENFLAMNKVTWLNSEKISPIIDTASSDLVEKFVEQPDSSPLDSWYQEQISNYIHTLLPPKGKTYHGQLSLLINDLAFVQKDEDITSTYVIAEKIFVNYADKLSFKDAVKILLIFSENDLFEHNYKSAMVILQWLYNVYPLLRSKVKRDFDFHIAQCFFHFGLQNTNHEYLYQAVTHSRNLLNYQNIDKNQLNTLLYIIIKSFETLGVYDESMLAIDEYFRNFPKFDFENQLFLEILYIKWEIYKKQKKYDLAIQSFRTYLKFHPNDKAAKIEIRKIAEEEGE